MKEILRMKYPLFATGGENKNISIFSNSIEYMGKLHGHSGYILCLAPLPPLSLASGGAEGNIKIWNLGNKRSIWTLTNSNYKTEGVTVLCVPRNGMLVSGSWSRLLGVWELIGQGDYALRYLLYGHASPIKGIVALNEGLVISGEWNGDLRIWDIIIDMQRDNCLWKSLGDEDLQRYYMVACCRVNKINLWGSSNNWKGSIQEFKFRTPGSSLEFLERNVLLRGGNLGELQIIEFPTGNPLQPLIQAIHSDIIRGILRIAKNIIVTISDDGSAKVSNPISRKCFSKFTDFDGRLISLIKFN